MEQLEMFDQPKENDEFINVIITEQLLAPFEVKEKLNSKEFDKERSIWKEHILAVQEAYKCTFVKAREMLIKSRDEKNVIKINHNLLNQPKIEKVTKGNN